MTRSLAAAAGLAAALAAPAGAAVYDATDFDDGPASLGLWTPNFVRNADDMPLPPTFWHWTMSDGRFETTDTGARLTGTATNRGDAALGFDLDLRFALAPNPPGSNSGYCQTGGAAFDCTDPGRPDGLTQERIDGWSFYTFDGMGILTGLGELAGITMTVGDVTGGAHKPQFGVGGNAHDREQLGFSTWVSWDLSGTDTSSIYNFLGSSTQETVFGHADINVDLAIAAVPVPAAGLLMLAGLGGLGLARRRR